MGGRDIVVIGASAGGHKALPELLEGMPRDFPAAVFIVLHRLATDVPLAYVYPRASQLLLPLQWAVDGERFSCGRVYLAPPDDHLLVERGRTRLERRPKESWFRPAIDVLFSARPRSRTAGASSASSSAAG